MTYTVNLGLEPGSNVLLLAVPSGYALDATGLLNFAAILGDCLDTGPQLVGTRKGTTFWLIGKGRPVTMQELEATPSRLSWHKKLGAPAGEEPRFLLLGIDWRGDSSRIEWQSDMFIAPKGSRCIRGQANWPDYRTVEEYREWLGDVATNEQWSAVASSVGKAADAASNIATSSFDALKWPLILVTAGALAYATRDLWAGKD